MRQDVIKNNSMGERLEYIKKKLNLTYQDIARDTFVPKTTIFDLVKGRRTTYYELLEYLAYYFDKKWQDKYSRNYPLFKNKELEKITFEWLVLGHNKTFQEHKKHISELKEHFYLENMRLVNGQ